MKALIAGLLLVAGCRDDVELFPVNPGGGGGESGTGFVDAGIDLGDANLTPMIAGRVCFLSDARRPRDCAATGADGLTVTLGAFTAVTAADGRFSIRRPSGTNLVWDVRGPSIFPSAMSLSAEALIPAIDIDVYAEMAVASVANAFDGSGAIINSITRAEDPLTGLIASVDPPPSGLVYYDGNDVEAWAANATGPLGVIWVPGLDPGAAQMVVNDGINDHPINGIPVFADAVTFMFTDIP